MPRGGRRPGAGAPKGNMNGFRNGNHCRRARLVYGALIAHPNPRAVAIALRDRGFYRPPANGTPGPDNPYTFNKRNVALVVAFLYPRLFDCPEAAAINSNQTQPAIAAQTPRSAPPPDSPPPADQPQPPEPAAKKTFRDAIKRHHDPNICLRCAFAAQAQRDNDDPEPRRSPSS